MGGGTPPYAYNWTSTGSTNSSITGLAAGSYTIVVTDANDCVLPPYTITVSQPNELLGAITDVGGTHCFGDVDGSATKIQLMKNDIVALSKCQYKFKLALLDPKVFSNKRMKLIQKKR